MKTLSKLALLSVLALSAAACTVIDPSSSSHSSSSGGDSKSASLMSREQRIARFTENNLDHLKRDISVGQGEYLSSLASLMQIETAQRPAFFAFVQGNFTRLFPSAQTRAADMLAALDREMRADPRFAERVALN
ncbi:DUF3015 family protein [Zoogloea sp.]|jgi:hypothetical protein|uniref:DUF3015 family protein n=1 Tax=Zoogloea sp. TaxID=49181 RepID=UPI001B7BBB05|nr:DUF3015 family protein [Zoogloea sp.]MBK6654691.1 DUF3015 family protein [Zoogloea sp.]MBP7446050.1 DUF3015 family protein [Zoogloea sp.]HOY02847.1 DUF3015 family protein [Zoogloea sp.]HPI61859.1 DUF3015 family protein [Zoogloea sp.]